MTDFEKLAEGIPRTDWFGADVLPARPGMYEVRNDPATMPGTRSRFRLKGGKYRYFDGTSWRAGWIPFTPLHETWTSIFGQHISHQWRGLARPAERQDHHADPV